MIRFLPFLIALIYRLLRASWRVQIYESPEFQRLRSQKAPVVYAHWHGDELAILHLLKPYRACAMVSTSQDGELMAQAIHHLGARTSRGSATRGGVSALRGILRLAKEGWSPSVAVDGPKGPLHRAKPGVFEISKILQAPIIPLVAHAEPRFVFEKAWNKTYLPLPFSRVQIVFADPLPAIEKAEDGRDEKHAQGLEQALANAQQYARKLIAAPGNVH